MTLVDKNVNLYEKCKPLQAHAKEQNKSYAHMQSRNGKNNSFLIKTTIREQIIGNPTYDWR